MELNGSDNPQDMSNIMNDFFADTGPDLANKIPDSLLEIDYSFQGGYEKFDFTLVTPDEVKKLMLGVPNNKSTGIDSVLIRFLKIDIETTSKILSHIIDGSLLSKIVP